MNDLDISYVNRKRADELIEQGDITIIDVRPPEMFAQSHLPGAVNVQLGDLEQQIETLVPNRDGKLLVYCEVGYLSGIAVEQLAALHYQEVYCLEGGLAG